MRKTILFVKFCDRLTQGFKRSDLDVGKKPSSKIRDREISKRMNVLVDLLGFELIW